MWPGLGTPGPEFAGAALLVTAVVGSGIAATRLSPSGVGLQLLENAVATALALGALILIFGPVSGAHFNPVVSAVDWWLGRRAGTASPGRTSSRTPWRRSAARSPEPSSPT
nr:aquaporin [Micromonospora provocatoris]